MPKTGLQPYDYESPRRRVPLTAALVLAALATGYYATNTFNAPAYAPVVPYNAAAILDRCSTLNAQVLNAPDFAERREVSDRFEPGTRPALVRNATLWTGDRVIHGGDVLIGKGIIKYVGRGLGRRELAQFNVEEHLVDSFNAQGAWVTPTLVDLHSHGGVVPLPNLEGSSDGNSLLGVVQPWLRSLDGLNTHDDAYELAVAGGVGTALIIPGSANAIGGQGFVVKLRPTKERSPFSKLVDPPFTYNGSGIVPAHPPKWRHIKHACGENPSRVYQGTRMDSIWAMRSIYDEARKVKEAQDAYCARAEAGQWNALGEFPDDLRLEALVDLFRGRVKAQIHCYEAVDLDNLVRLSNEFRFKIAAFHHAHETYLVPDVLKKAYGGAPASAIFANFARYKRESYRHSEFAPRILHDAGLDVIMKSDAPDPINMRDLLYEAQQAYYFGLPEHTALSSVTTTPAKVLGLDHRLGYLRAGYDADLVIWDSHPLQVGATPGQVFIDGIAQLEKPVVTHRTLEQQKAPVPPSFDKEAEDAVKYEGLPPLEPERIPGAVRFKNVKRVRRAGVGAKSDVVDGDVLVRDGRIACMGVCAKTTDGEERDVDLQGGELAPGLTAFGGFHGLMNIDMEISTSDGPVPDTLPSLLGRGALVRAADGVMFGTRDALLAYRSGVTRAITPPITFGWSAPQFLGGLSATLSFGANHRLEDGALPKAVTALHVNIERGTQWSVSTQIGALRRLLTSGHAEGDLKEYFLQALLGEIPLIVQADGADIVASLIELKNDIGRDSKLKLAISSAAEAHLLAKELASANIGIIAFPRTYPVTWDQRRVARRPPLEKGNNLSILLAHNVSVAIGRPGMWRWRARQLRFDLNWAVLESDGALSYSDALALATTNVEALFGLELNPNDRDMVAYAGGDMFSQESKVVAVVAPLQSRVDVF
ncbi:hypothetical protein AURDEDRAFT_111071 [Auricularia subglabra TFB-10046 SS5]|nr:hypothetical protein AURDEDRAFT_111071 [Auricularia subglabra TFB-10046 SS5]